MIGAGAIGNLIDRLAFGQVTDMFWFRAIDFPVFNVADACITVGVILLFIASMVRSEVGPAQPQVEAERPDSYDDEPDSTGETADDSGDSRASGG
jgi:signal peptidase II